MVFEILNGMKFIHKSFFGILSAILVGVIFFSGFYVGSNQSFKPHYSADASVAPVDMAAFWKAWEILDQKFIETGESKIPSPQERLYGAIEGMVGSYEDPYTVFFPPAAKTSFETAISGNFEGVGMEVDVRDGNLTIIAPIKNAPADKAGLKSGDKIIKINDTFTSGMTIEEAVTMIRGKKGSKVRFTVEREGETEPLSFSVTRAVINMPSLETEYRSDGVFVISLYNFNANASIDFRDALKRFVSSGSKKLIIDLRGNPGGYLDSAVDMTSWFLPTGKVIVREDFGGGEEKELRSKGYNLPSKYAFKTVVLVNGGSASASEIMAGALQEHKVAALVGEQTFGKGSVQELVDVTSKTSLKVTIARWLTPNGKSISDGGLKPDHVIELTKKDVEAKKDPQMQKALDLLK